MDYGNRQEVRVCTIFVLDVCECDFFVLHIHVIECVYVQVKKVQE